MNDRLANDPRPTDRGAWRLVAMRDFRVRLRDKGFFISTGITLAVLTVFILLRAFGDEVEGGGDLVSERPQQDEHRQHRERDAGGDEEALVPQPHPEVPHRDQAPGAAVVGLGSCARRSFTRSPPHGTARRAWDAPARTQPRCPTPRAEIEDALLVDVVGQLEHGAVLVLTSTSPTPDFDPYHSSEPAAVPARGRVAARGGPEGRRSSPWPHDVVDQHDPVAQPLHEVELVAREHHGHPGRGLLAQQPAIASTPAGSSPLNGSSSTSSVGLAHERRASCTRCWLPSESFSTWSFARSAHAQPGDRLPRRRPRVGLGDPVQPRQVDELVERRASSGRGRAPRACSRTAAVPR